MKIPYFLIPLLGLLTQQGLSQEADWTALLSQNRLAMNLNKTEVKGPGFDWIQLRAEASQFVAFGESHARAEVPMLIGAVYRQLYAQGYHYLALEIGPEIARELSASHNLGRKSRVKRLAVKHPKALAFAYDHELRMLAASGAKFEAPGQVFWGLDQAFGGKHLVKRLKSLASDPEESAAAKSVLKQVRKAGNGHKYLTQADRDEDIAQLRKAFQAEERTAETRLINTLEVSNRIYRNWVKAYGTKDDRLAGYDNVHEREELMKSQFIEMYRETQNLGVAKPKVILKFGGAHIEPGLTSNLVTSLGGFVKDFAIAEGSKSTTIAMVHTTKKYPPTEGGRLLLLEASRGEISLFDFSKLKNQAMNDSSMPANLKRMILRYDAVIFIPNSKKAGIGNYIRSKIGLF